MIRKVIFIPHRLIATSYSEEKILYKKVDTLINGINLQFYRHSNNPDSNLSNQIYRSKSK